MRKYEGRLVGILGTVILHLIAGIVFMSFKMRSLDIEKYEKYVIEFAPAEEEMIKDKLIKLPATAIERILKGDDEMMNIARNLANKPTEEINPADYIDKVKEELIKSGKLGTNNYIDEQKRLRQQGGDEKLAMESDSASAADNKPKESQNMAANYKGPTRIYYDLKGRTHLYLPIPIYKCQGSGKVVLSIEVTQEGDVNKALVVAEESSTSDPCLIETAVNTALISRFNPDNISPKIQKGTITYHFVSQ